MKKAMEEMKDFMRKANHVDDLVHGIDSPFPTLKGLARVWFGKLPPNTITSY